MLILRRLKFASGRCNNCAKCCCVSLSCFFAHSHFCSYAHRALRGVDVAAASLKAKLCYLGLSLIDNTQPQLPVAVSSPSSLSSKTTIADPASAFAPVSINDVAFELKTTGLLPSVKKYRLKLSFLVGKL